MNPLRGLTEAISKLATEVHELHVGVDALRREIKGQNEDALKKMTRKLDSAGDKLADAVENNQPTQT